MKIGILEPSDFSSKAIKRLTKLGQVSLFDGKHLDTFVKDKEVLFVRLNFDINKALLSKAKKLRYICSPTTGLNHIDTVYCNKHGIEIISLKGETAFLRTIRATPEHTLGVLISLNRNYKSAFLNTKNSVWNREPYKGFEIYNSKVGIIGMGRVGSILSKYLNAMGAKVGYYDINSKIKIDNAKAYKTKSALIKWADSIVLSANFDSNQGEIIGSKELELMKGKTFINTARAELTDENLLVKLASKGHFKALALDVIREEQSSQKNLETILKATQKYNIIITPHIGGATFTSMERTEEFITKKLVNKVD